MKFFKGCNHMSTSRKRLVTPCRTGSGWVYELLQPYLVSLIIDHCLNLNLKLEVLTAFIDHQASGPAKKQAICGILRGFLSSQGFYVDSPSRPPILLIGDCFHIFCVRDQTFSRSSTPLKAPRDGLIGKKNSHIGVFIVIWTRKCLRASACFCRTLHL